MIPEGTDNHILDSKADAENEDYKYQAKALSAIKKGLETSVFELHEQISKLQSTIEEKDNEIEKLNRFLSGKYDKLAEEHLLSIERKEIERLKGLIWKLWEVFFYLTCPSSVHEGVMDELYKQQKEKFKTENNL